MKTTNVIPRNLIMRFRKKSTYNKHNNEKPTFAKVNLIEENERTERRNLLAEMKDFYNFFFATMNGKSISTLLTSLSAIIVMNKKE